MSHFGDICVGDLYVAHRDEKKTEILMIFLIVGFTQRADAATMIQMIRTTCQGPGSQPPETVSREWSMQIFVDYMERHAQVFQCFRDGELIKHRGGQ